MDTHTISTKELRERLPEIREELARGREYVLIHRSKPIARIEPLRNFGGSSRVRVKGGSLRLQAKTKQRLTPAYLNALAAQKYA